MPPKPFFSNRLDGGLNTTDPAPHLHPSDLVQADNAICTDGAIEKAPGFVRALKNRPRSNAFILDGDQQHFRGRIRSTGSNVALQSTDWTIEVFFRLDTLPDGLGRATLLYRGIGEDSAASSYTASKTDYAISLVVDSSTGLPFVQFFFSDGSSTATVSNSATIEIGKCYRACLVNTETATVETYTSFVHEVGTAIPSSGGGGTLTNGVTDSGSDIFVGATPDEDSLGSGDAVTFPFPGIVQEVRIWNEARDSSGQDEYDDAQIAAPGGEATLVVLYQLTGTGSNAYFFRCSVGTKGDGSGESPVLALEPRTGTWVTSSHVLGNPMAGTSTLDLNGKTQFVPIPDSYLYRDQVPGDDGALPFVDQFFFSCRVKLRSVVDQATIFHYVEVPDEDWTSHEEDLVDSTDAQGNGVNSPWAAHATVNGDVDATGQCFLEVRDMDETAGTDYRFRFVVYHVVSGTTEATAVVSTDTVVADTEYTVSCWINGSGTAAIKVDSTATDTSSMTGLGLPPPSVDDPGNQRRKYAAVLGTAIKRTRRQLAVASADGIDVEYNIARCLDGELRQVIIADVTDGNFVGLHAQNRDYEWGRSEITQLGTPIYSAWSMDDADGNDAEDYGVQTNPLPLSMDPGHVWGRSCISTTNNALWKGAFEHRYQGKDGAEVRKVIGVAGGALFDLDLANRTYTMFADGIRNDDGNIVSTIRARDGIVLCFGGKGRTNFHLWKDQLYGLSIDPPSGTLAFGLTDQLSDEGKLTAGEYNVGFAFYSAHLDKWSPLGMTANVRIRSERANIAYGSSAEINQTHASTPYSGSKAGALAEAGREPFDVSVTQGNNNALLYESWVGPVIGSTVGASDPDWWEDPPGAGSTIETKQYRIRFQKGGPIGLITEDNDDELDADTAIAHVNFITPPTRAFMDRHADGRVRLRSSFVGADAHLKLGQNGTVASADTGFAFDTAANLADVSAGTPTEYDGTGDSAHTLTLPTTNDKQVTHVGYFRSLVDSDSYRLVALIPIGVPGFVDYTPDEENTGEIFDVTSGVVPTCGLVTDYENRAIYTDDKLNPQRLYFSEVGEPWNVPAQNVIDFLDGDTLAITAIGRTEGGVVVFKDETTFVLSPPTNPIVPFTVSVRSRDVGCNSKRGVVNVEENLVYPSEKGLFRFDLSYPQYISGRIEPTWNELIDNGGSPVRFAHHNRRLKILMFSVVSGDTQKSGTDIPDKILIWSYGNGADQQGRPRGWSMLTNVNATFFATVEDSNDVEQTLFGDSFGVMYLYNSGTSYGPGALITHENLAVTGGSSTTIVVPQCSDLTTFPSGYIGMFVTLTRSADGSQETRIVTADDKASPSTLTVQTWSGTAPANGDRADVGVIEFDAVTGDLSPIRPDSVHEVSAALVRQEAQSSNTGTWSLSATGLGGVPTEVTTTVSITNTLGWFKAGFLPAVAGLGVRLRFKSFAANLPIRLYDYSLLISPAADHGRFGKNP